MVELAIRGHTTRGKKIIELLEMLGGKNKYNVDAIRDYCIYFVENGIISTLKLNQVLPNQFTIFTLEEFLEKYPYKVGDKVLYKYDNKTYFIRKMFWENDKILYELSDEIYSDGCSIPDTVIFDVDAVKLQPYKEQEIMYLNRKANKQFEEIKKVLESAKEIIEEKTDTAFAPDLKGQDYSGKRFGYKMPNGYEFECVRNNEVILKPVKPQYPKTYKECCSILDVEPYSRSAGYKSGLITAFRNLLICRDAYWKIAGEEIGLGKPWEPNWNNSTEIKYCITTVGYTVEYFESRTVNIILAFPTKEIRETFDKNFKELIEFCKELL